MKKLHTRKNKKTDRTLIEKMERSGLIYVQ